MSQETFKKIIADAVGEALIMSLNTPRLERATKLLEINLNIADRLSAAGIDPALAKGIKIDIPYVASDES